MQYRSNTITSHSIYMISLWSMLVFSLKFGAIYLFYWTKRRHCIWLIVFYIGGVRSILLFVINRYSISQDWLLLFRFTIIIVGCGCIDASCVKLLTTFFGPNIKQTTANARTIVGYSRNYHRRESLSGSWIPSLTISLAAFEISMMLCLF